MSYKLMHVYNELTGLAWSDLWKLWAMLDIKCHVLLDIQETGRDRYRQGEVSTTITQSRPA